MPNKKLLGFLFIYTSVRNLKTFEEFDWGTISQWAPLIIVVIVNLLVSKVYLPYKTKKRLIENFKESWYKGYEIKNENNLIKIYRRKFRQDSELMFEINPETRKIKYVNQNFKTLEGEFKVSKKEMENILNQLPKHTNIKEDLSEILQELKDNYYYDYDISDYNLQMDKFTINLKRNNLRDDEIYQDMYHEYIQQLEDQEDIPNLETWMSEVKNKYDDDIEEFQPIVEEAIDRIEDQYNVKLSNKCPREMSGFITYSISKDENQNLILNLVKGSGLHKEAGDPRVLKFKGLKQLPHSIDLVFEKEIAKK